MGQNIKELLNLAPVNSFFYFYLQNSVLNLKNEDLNIGNLTAKCNEVLWPM